MYDSILIGVDEIWVKSERVKNILMKKLADDISRRINANIKIGRGRIFIFDYKEDWIKILSKVFGVKTIYPSKMIETDINKIVEESLKFFENFSGSFKLVVNRVYKNFPLTSYEVAKEVGKKIVEKYNLKVDVKNPDKILYIEIHPNFTFLYDKIIYGPGGFPLGSEGKGLVLFSGGIDSSVAAYMMGKRGMDLDFLFINTAGNFYLQYVYRVFEKLKEYFPDSKLYVWDLDIDKLLLVKEGYRQILFKVIIYKIAEEFAKSKKYDCIITGESLGQVSSQTIESLKILDSLSNYLFFRPLIGFNKDEIIELSKRIGVYEIRAPEICQIEKHPFAKPKLDIILEELKKININFKEEINKVYELKNIQIDEYNLNLPERNKVIVVTSDKFNNYEFEKGNKYLLVCKTGIIARYYAEKLKQNGIEAYYLDEKTAKRLGYINP